MEGSKQEAVDWKISLALPWSPSLSPWLARRAGCRGVQAQTAKEAASQPISSLRTHISSVAHPSVRDAAEFYRRLIPFKGQGQAETQAGLQYQPAALKEADPPCQGLVHHCS